MVRNIKSALNLSDFPNEFRVSVFLAVRFCFDFRFLMCSEIRYTLHGLWGGGVSEAASKIGISIQRLQHREAWSLDEAKGPKWLRLRLPRLG